MAERMTEDRALVMMLRREEERLVARCAELERELDRAGRRLEHVRALLGSGSPPAPAPAQRETPAGTLRSVA